MIGQKSDGTITVFLSLILIIILSLLLTIVEGARVNTTKAHAERALATAMDSVLAEYYGPLWEEYHIFGYYPKDKEEGEKEEIIEKLKKYMQYTMQPSTGIIGLESSQLFNYYPIQIDKLSVMNEATLMDYQGELLINEAVEYMKYQTLGNVTEGLLDKLSLLESPKKISYVYEKKQEVEEELVEIDIGILELMELLDGVKTSKNGIELSKQGKLSVAEYFVKMLCFSKPTAEKVGINNNEVFLALEGSYNNPTDDFNLINTSLGQLEEEQKSIKDIEEKWNTLCDKIKQKEEALDRMEDIESKTKDYAMEFSAIEKEIETLSNSKRELEIQLDDHKKSKEQLTKEIKKTAGNLKLLLEELEQLIHKSIACVNNLIIKSEEAAPLLKKYKDYLYSQKDSMDENTFTGLEEDLKGLEKYTNADENGYNFAGMKPLLDENLKQIVDSSDLINQGLGQLLEEQFQATKTSFDNALNTINKYKIKDLKLDYSTLVLDKADQKNPITGINDLLNKGIASLVIDPQSISENKLTEETLPSDIAALSESNTDIMSLFGDFFKNATGNNSSGLGSVFGGLGANTDISTVMSKGVNSVAEKFLYLDYLKEHFYSYNNKDTGSQKPSALSYELEYLLCEKSSDAQNLSSVIMQIALLRTVMDFASIVGDSTKRNEARALAILLVGFTGLPILIGITQAIILLAWSFAEALLDVCALMMGKEIPIIKKKAVLELPEIFLVNRTYLQTKAKAMSDPKEFSLAYQDYLNIFLVIKNKKDLTYHALDLMQENIKLRYDTGGFQIDRCLYGFEVKADYIIPSNFTNLKVVSKVFKNPAKSYLNSIQKAYSY